MNNEIFPAVRTAELNSEKISQRTALVPSKCACQRGMCSIPGICFRNSLPIGLHKIYAGLRFEGLKIMLLISITVTAI